MIDIYLKTSIMLFKLKLLLLIVSFFLTSNFAQATHCVGAEITYTYLGVPNEYGITLNFYRDCSGRTSPSNPIIDFKSVSCAFTGYAILDLISVTEVSKYCTSVITTCKNGTFVGVEKYVYYTEVIMPYRCTDWILSFELCCRNAGITNLSFPDTETFYVYSKMNNSIYDNSSPIFNSDPAPFVCLGSSYCFDNGAIDVDGDSLVYSQVMPKQAATTNVIYVTPFTYLKPITSSPVLTFNTTTGKLCFTPTTQEIDVFAILISSYKNGVLINQVERDIELTVTTCPCVPLPVELVEFDGRQLGDHIELLWVTASEHNNNYFEIEKCVHDSTFLLIKKIPAAHYSNKETTYGVIDTYPVLGNNIYKLYQVDFDGTRVYLGFVVINYKRDLNNFLYEYINGLLILKRYNLLGQEIK